MFFLKINENSSCATCRYANLYIPYFTYPYSDPYCSKGHGKCDENKVCGDYLTCGFHYCKECGYFDEGFCKKEKKDIYKYDISCVYFLDKGKKLHE